MERLRTDGVYSHPFSYSAKSKSVLGAMALRLVRERRWSLPRTPDLLRDFRELRVVDRPDGTFYVEVPRSARSHGDTAESVLLASYRLLHGQPMAKSGQSAERSRREGTWGCEGDALHVRALTRRQGCSSWPWWSPQFVVSLDRVACARDKSEIHAAR